MSGRESSKTPCTLTLPTPFASRHAVSLSRWASLPPRCSLPFQAPAPSLERRPPRRSTTRPPSSRPPAPASPSSNLKTWSAPTAPTPIPLLKEAAAKYNIPWVRHDFPLPFHPWSFQAAVNARWFDTKSKKMGDDYRDAVFANQRSIESLDAAPPVH